jgi:hypothetical protein
MNEFAEVFLEQDRNVLMVLVKRFALIGQQEEFVQIGQWVKFAEQPEMAVVIVKGLNQVQVIVLKLAVEEFANKFRAQDIAVW